MLISAVGILKAAINSNSIDAQCAHPSVNVFQHTNRPTDRIYGGVVFDMGGLAVPGPSPNAPPPSSSSTNQPHASPSLGRLRAAFRQSARKQHVRSPIKTIDKKCFMASPFRRSEVKGLHGTPEAVTTVAC